MLPLFNLLRLLTLRFVLFDAELCTGGAPLSEVVGLRLHQSLNFLFNSSALRLCGGAHRQFDLRSGACTLRLCFTNTVWHLLSQIHEAARQRHQLEVVVRRLPIRLRFSSWHLAWWWILHLLLVTTVEGCE